MCYRILPLPSPLAPLCFYHSHHVTTTQPESYNSTLLFVNFRKIVSVFYYSVNSEWNNGDRVPGPLKLLGCQYPWAELASADHCQVIYITICVSICVSV